MAGKGGRRTAGGSHCQAGLSYTEAGCVLLFVTQSMSEVEGSSRPGVARAPMAAYPGGGTGAQKLTGFCPRLRQTRWKSVGGAVLGCCSFELCPGWSSAVERRNTCGKALL